MNLKELASKKIEDRDEANLDPNERAELVNTFLFDKLGLTEPKDFIAQPLFWDLVCFCTEFLNLYAMQLDDDDTVTLARAWNNHIYSTHYSLPDTHDALGPDRESHRAIWRERFSGDVGDSDGITPKNGTSDEHPERVDRD